MKLSKETIGILKNFSGINSNLFIKSGSNISTISVGKSLVAMATVPEQFTQEFGIYDLSEFLGLVSLFEDPEITFDEDYLTIGSGNHTIRYYSADEGVLVYPKKTPDLPEAEFTFTLTESDISKITKTASVLKTSDFAFVADGKQIKAIVKDKSSKTANSFELVIGETTDTYKISLNIENFKVIPANFTVGIINRRMMNMVADNLSYIVAIETDSVFE